MNEWSRGRLLGVLSGAAVVAVVLLVGLGYAIYLVVARTGASDARPRRRHRRHQPTELAQGTARRDEIAAQPMLPVPDNAPQPDDASSSKTGTIEVPAGTGLTGPALVITGFPHTPEGAIGQLAQIDTAVLSSMSPQTAREVYSAWALPGGVAAEDWWTATTVDSFLTSSGMGDALAPDAAVTVEPAAALVKGTDGPDWTTVCVLMKVSATYRSEAQTGWGHCERMQWVGGRWMIAPGQPPAPAPATWPGSGLAVKAGWRTWKTTTPPTPEESTDMDPASHSLRSRTVALIALAVVTAAAVWMLTRPDTTDSGGPSASTHPNVQTSAVASGHGSASKRESPQTSPKGGVVLPGAPSRSTAWRPGSPTPTWARWLPRSRSLAPRSGSTTTPPSRR